MKHRSKFHFLILSKRNELQRKVRQEGTSFYKVMRMCRFCVTYVTLYSCISVCYIAMCVVFDICWEEAMSGCLTNAERRCVFEVVMHVSFLLFIVIFITSFILNSYRGGKMWRNVTYVRMILCFGRSYVEKVRGKLCEDSIFDVTHITALHT